MNNKDLEDLKLYGIRNRLKYLEATDWYIIRKCETNNAIPTTILEKRQLARDTISQITEATTFEQISDINIKFD